MLHFIILISDFELNSFHLQGVTALNNLKVDKHTSYEHHTSINEFQQSLADVLREDLFAKLSLSKKYSLMFDESTDISVQQNLILYIRYLDYNVTGGCSSETNFLSIIGLQRANAHAIYDKVLDILRAKGLDLSNLSGLCTDGAAVMVGSKSGVVTCLKQAVPGVLATHCIAHRLALSCSSGADSIPYLLKFQETLNSIYKFFNNSPKNMSTLSAIQSVLNSHSTRFQEVFHTRWLSFEGAVAALVCNYSSLLSVFLEEKSARSLSLHKPVSTYKFLYVAHFLSDALKPLAILSKMYQTKDLNYADVEPQLTSTISSLESLKEKKDGSYISTFLSACPSEPDADGLYTFEFDGHTIRDSTEQRRVAVSVCDQFITKMVASLNARFSDNEDGSVMRALSNLFNPSLSVSQVSEDLEIVSDFLGTVGVEGSRNELSLFVRFSREYGSVNQSVTDHLSCANLAIRRKEMYPAAAEAAERFLILPVSSADCERGFSKQNLIKTTLRNSLSNSCLDTLLVLSIDGPPLSSFPFKRSFKLWAASRNRRILM